MNCLDFKFNVGETVQVSYDLVNYSYTRGITKEMKKYAGKTFKITSRYISYYAPYPLYTLQGDIWLWDERWLIPVGDNIVIQDNEIGELFEF